MATRQPAGARTDPRTADVGIRAINALLSVGRGQRLGLFAGSGVGKSVLLGMMTRYTDADVVVVGLIGERGREVKEFVDNILGEEGLRRAVVVAPADQPPLRRMHGRCDGDRRVFPRPGQACPVADGFTDALPRRSARSVWRSTSRRRPRAIRPRCSPSCRNWSSGGNGDRGGGSITAFYTVLAEGDDQNDPIADAARERSSTGISCCRAVSPSRDSIRRSISRASVAVR